jgi:hypothetical protein
MKSKKILKKKTENNVIKIGKNRKELRLSNGMLSEPSINRVAQTWYSIPSLKTVPREDFINKCREALGLYHHLIKHRGVTQGTKRFKDIRAYTLKWMLGHDPQPVPCLSLYKDKFPRDLSFVRDLARKGEIQTIMTILSITRLSKYAEHKSNQKYKSITSGINRTKDFYEVLNGFSSALPGLLRKIGWTEEFNSKELGKRVRFHGTTKAGPNSNLTGVDGLMSSVEDAIALTNDKYLFNRFRNICTLYGLEEFPSYVEKLADPGKEPQLKPRQPYKGLPEKKGKSLSGKSDKKGKSPSTGEVSKPREFCHSRLLVIPDPENKVRIAACVDYFSQMMFYPVENLCNRVEALVPNSFMFNQDGGRERARMFTINGNPYSLDASSFTDRFPMDVQCKVLECLTNKEFTSEFRALMVNRDFKVPRSKEGKTVRYNAGQPMGAHGSFQLANLTHALFALWIVSNGSHSDEWQTSSAVVGDDIVFRYDGDGESYHEKMTHLGVEFSVMKGFRSGSREDKVAEFCKRLYLNGKSVSAFSPRPALNYARDYKHISSFIENCKLDQSQTISVVNETNKSRKSEVTDLLLAQELLRNRSSSPFYGPLGTLSNGPLEDLREFCLHTTEELSSCYVGAIVFMTLFKLVLEQSAREQESYFSNFSSSAGKPVEIDSSHIDPIKMVEILTENVQSISLGKLQEDLLYRRTIQIIQDKDEQVRVAKPLLFIYLGDTDDKLYSESPEAEVLFDILLGGEASRATRISKFSRMNFDVGQAIDSLKTSIFSGTISSSVSLGKRSDERMTSERDKVLFMLAKRLITVLSDIEYRGDGIGLNLPDLPTIEISFHR